MADNDKDKKKKASHKNDVYKHAISMIESAGGKYLDNKNSSAAGKYHFLYKLIKNDPDMKGVTKRDFINDEALQDKIMDKALDGKLKGYTYGRNYADKLKKEFKSDYSQPEIMALIHFLGPGNSRKFLKSPDTFKVPGVNISPTEYVDRYRKFSGQYKHPSASSSPVEPLVKDKDQIREEMFQPQPMDEIPGKQYLYEQNFPKAPTGPNDVEINIPNPNELKTGGHIDTADAGDNVTVFEGGGSHDENPNGGIPQGMGANGKPNLVEEGETKWNDYIFSNAISLDGKFDESKTGDNKFENGGPLDPPPVSNIEQNAIDNSISQGRIAEANRVNDNPISVGQKFGNYSVQFVDPTGNRSMMMDDKGHYNLVDNRHLQTSLIAEKGGASSDWLKRSKQYNSRDARYFMDNTPVKKFKFGGGLKGLADMVI